MIDVVARLAAAGCIAPRREARELLRDAPSGAVLEDRLQRRESGEPLAWIIGRVEFAGLVLEIHPGVYVPRTQSEELARRAAALLPRGGTVIDLCAGNGAIAAAIQDARPAARVVAVDIDPVAAQCAARNGVRVLVADLAAPLHAAGVVDVVTAVAPYVPAGVRHLLPADVQRHEPPGALDGGHDGLAVVRRVVEQAERLLAPGGHLLVEAGGVQDELLAADLARHGFRWWESWHDDDGDLRGLVARR